jgi:hypothetical protein
MAYTGPFPIPVKDGGTGAQTLTNHCVLLGNGTNAVSAFSAATNGQLIIGNTGNAPSLATLTSTGASITITNGAGTINLESAGGGGGASTFNADTGSATESLGAVTIAGDTTNIFTSGSGSTVTVSLGTNILLPNTNAAGTEGIIEFGGASFINNYGSNNVFIGSNVGNLTLTTGNATNNTAIGTNCLQSVTLGDSNCAYGWNCMSSATTDEANVAIGGGSMRFSAASFFNTCVGFGSMNGGSGNYNVCLGYNAGTSYGATESSNILIGADGTGGESNTIRIGGVLGSGDQQQNKCFISGIYGITTVSATTAPLLISDTGQLGTVVSAARFKENIIDMDSGNIMQLRPVNFSYKSDKTHMQQYGFIAEEVAEIMPQIVTYDEEGKPFTVRYHDLPAILLNEIKKLNKRIEILESK